VFFGKQLTKRARRMDCYGKHAGEGAKPEGEAEEILQ
jgi:hypothetical protein